MTISVQCSMCNKIFIDTARNWVKEDYNGICDKCSKISKGCKE